MTAAPIIPDEVGEHLDSSKSDAVNLLLELAKASYRDHDALSLERINLMEAATEAHRSRQWLDVVDYALVLEVFLDTHGYWQEDTQNLELALEAAKNVDVVIFLLMPTLCSSRQIIETN